MTWSLPKEKIDTYMYTISEAANKALVSAKELYTIDGLLNVIITHAPVLKSLRADIVVKIKQGQKEAPRCQTLTHFKGLSHELAQNPECSQSRFPHYTPSRMLTWLFI